jgi:hypothetical protein
MLQKQIGVIATTPHGLDYGCDIQSSDRYINALKYFMAFVRHSSN